MLKIQTTRIGGEILAAANKGLAKVAVQWLIEHLCFVSSAVLAESFVLRIRHLRQAPKRYRTFRKNPNKYGTKRLFKKTN